MGANKEYIQSRIPHLSSRLVPTLEELIEHSEILLLTRNGEELVQRIAEMGKRPTLVDLRGQDKMVKKLLAARKRRKLSDTSLLKAEPQGIRNLVPGKNGSRNGNGKAKELVKA